MSYPALSRHHRHDLRCGSTFRTDSAGRQIENCGSQRLDLPFLVANSLSPLHKDSGYLVVANAISLRRAPKAGMQSIFIYSAVLVLSLLHTKTRGWRPAFALGRPSIWPFPVCNSRHKFQQPSIHPTHPRNIQTQILHLPECVSKTTSLIL